MKTALVVDDHAIVREGLIAMLRRIGFERVEEESSGYKALDLLEKNDFDLVVLDIHMPSMDGLELLERIREKNKSLKVLVLSMYSEAHYAVRALKAGANGYLTKDTVSHELEEAVKKVAAGGKYITMSLAERLVDELSGNRETLPHERLTKREFQIFSLILDGKSPSDIADQLHLSVKTVSTHRAKIMEKMGMKSTVELVRYAIKFDLCE